jgi:hypothetical protein
MRREARLDGQRLLLCGKGKGRVVEMQERKVVRPELLRFLAIFINRAQV